MVHAAIEQAQAGDVIVVVPVTDSPYGFIGELMATQMQVRGVRAYVTSGGVRDTAELRAMGFPVWTAHVSAQGTVKDTAGSVNVPVVLGGVVVNPGDIVVADDDGVTIVPRERAGEALAAARARAAKEAANRRALRGRRDLDGSQRSPTRARRPRRALYHSGGIRRCLTRCATASAACSCAGGPRRAPTSSPTTFPLDPAERDDLLLRVMGSPDPTQIDGLGGAHPLTSKVAIVSPSSEPDVDIDYLFLQVVVDQPTVSDAQTCGNLLAGVGPFAVERGLIAAGR